MRKGGPTRLKRNGLRLVLLGVIGVAAAALACETRPPIAGATIDPPVTTIVAPCGADGTTRSCHGLLGEHNGVRSCYDGVQSCQGGAWSACVGSGTTRMFTDVNFGGYVSGSEPYPGDDQVRQVSTKSLTVGGSDANACSVNPCDPYCVGFDEDAGSIRPDASATGGANSWMSVDPLGGVPGGFVNKGIEDPCDRSSDCNFDTYCDKTTVRACPGGKTAPCGTCVFYKPTGKNAACVNAIDLTAGAPCNDKTYPICNRGTKDLLKATYPKLDVYQKNGGGNEFGSVCMAGPTAACEVTIPAAGIKAGTCISVPTCGNSGNVTVFVNPSGGTNTVPECALGSELGCVNNWSDIKSPSACTSQGGGVSYLQKVYTQQYTATCPAGSQPQWQWLGFDTSTPSSGGTSSTITIKAHVASKLADGGPGTFGSYATMAIVPTNTAQGACAINGGDAGGCPKDLYTALGGKPTAQQEVLELQFTLDPSTDALVAPTLKSWQVSYSCPPNQ